MARVSPPEPVIMTADTRLSPSASLGFFQKCSKGLLDVGEMPFIIRKKKMLFIIQNGYLYGSGTDVDSESM